MKVSDFDQRLYTTAIEFISNKVELTRSLSAYRGISAFNVEDVSAVVISSIKEWLVSRAGEEWLCSIGYIKSHTTEAVLSVSGSICPVCSGVHLPSPEAVCESCGLPVCDPCITVVDPHYQVGWCRCCVENHALTNLLEKL